MNTFVIGGKRYRIRSKARFVAFVTSLILLAATLCGFAFSAAAHGAEPREYVSVRIEQGDTLWAIAAAHRPADKSTRQLVAEIREKNEVDPGHLYAGQVIEVPRY